MITMREAVRGVCQISAIQLKSKYVVNINTFKTPEERSFLRVYKTVSPSSAAANMYLSAHPGNRESRISY